MPAHPGRAADWESATCLAYIAFIDEVCVMFSEMVGMLSIP